MSTWDRPEIRRIAEFAVKDMIEETGLVVTFQHFITQRLAENPIPLVVEQSESFLLAVLSSGLLVRKGITTKNIQIGTRVHSYFTQVPVVWSTNNTE